MLLDNCYILQDSARLRDYYAALHPGVLHKHKQIDNLDDYTRRLIALSPFVVLGTQISVGLIAHPRVVNWDLFR